MSVNHDVGLSCIQRMASNRQGRPPEGVALHGKGRDLRYTVGKTTVQCLDAPVYEPFPARRAETGHINPSNDRTWEFRCWIRSRRPLAMTTWRMLSRARRSSFLRLAAIAARAVRRHSAT